MDSMTDTKKKIKYPTLIVALLAFSFLFGGAAAIVAYATGNEVVDGASMMMISHTEYRYSEPGQIIARLVDFQGNPVTVNNCTTDILYPDKSFFVQAALMSPSTNITGDHYYGFTTPAGPEGVYEYQATCTYAAGAKTASVTNSFHLSGAFNSVFNNLTQIQSDLAAVNSSLSIAINDSTNTILTELANVNGSLYNEMNNINTSLTQYINQTFNDLNASFGGDIENVLTEIDNLQTNINNQLACAGATYNENVSEDINATWTAHGTAPYYNRGIAINTVYPNSLLEEVTEAPSSDTNRITVFDENFTVLYNSSAAGGPTYYPNVNLPYVGKYYIMGTRENGSYTWTRYKSTNNITFSGTMYSFANGFECGQEIITCSGYNDLGQQAWEIDTLRLSASVDTGEADMCQLIRDVNASIQDALNTSFTQLNTNLAGNFSVVTTNQQQMNVTLNNIETFAQEINITTHNTYDYVTGTLANNVNQILTDLGVINATVNRIENTTDVILANQEAEVHMTVFSG
jgi:hypothetical protein